MIIYTVSFTENGDKLNRKLIAQLKEDNAKSFFKADIHNRLKEFTEAAFAGGDAIIFIGATGIAVRAIAPYIKSKADDPAVVVCDEQGKFVIPILSGHIGGANELAAKISTLINAIPVVTTATDINNIWAVDSWAVKKGLKILNIEEIKYISSAMLRGEKIGLLSDTAIMDKLPENVIFNNYDMDCGIVISPYLKKPYKHTLNLIPKCLSIGVGSRKNANVQALCKLLDVILAEKNIDAYAIENIATIDIKRNESSVLKLCESLNKEIICYSCEELNEVSGSFNTSDFVKSVTGTDNVCERSAIKAADNGKIIVSKTAGNGVTMAIALRLGGVKQ